MYGNWNINIINTMPQVIATAFADLSDKLVGAEYTFIAYFGSQIANGTNHAVLAEQLITTGKDSKNIVVMIFNEKPEGVVLVSIDRVLESGGLLGGTSIDVRFNIAGVAKDVWEDAFKDFVGSKITPCALLGTQILTGTKYIYLATIGVKSVVVVTVDVMFNKTSFVDILASKQESSLQYAFNW